MLSLQPHSESLFQDGAPDNTHEPCDEREKLIKYNHVYYAKHRDMPQTTLEYYKFTKLIGKGAFGKVTLGIHKLTGKTVAIKTVDKSLMKDEYSKRKLL